MMTQSKPKLSSKIMTSRSNPFYALSNNYKPTNIKNSTKKGQHPWVKIRAMNWPIYIVRQIVWQNKLKQWMHRLCGWKLRFRGQFYLRQASLFRQRP